MKQKTLSILLLCCIVFAMVPMMAASAASSAQRPSCGFSRTVTGEGTLVVTVQATGSSAWWNLTISGNGQTLYNQDYGNNVSLTNLPNGDYTVSVVCSPFTQSLDFTAVFQ